MRPVPHIDRRARRLGKFALGLIFDGYLSTHVSGGEQIPPEGVPTIVVSNHTSALDVFAGGHAIQRAGYFLAKAEAVKIPIVGRFLRAVGAIPAQRRGQDIAALKTMVAVLEAGHLLGVAPEGTRSSDGRLLPYDPGFVWLARRTGAAVVPCAIHGTWRLLPKGRHIPKRGDIWIGMGAPVDVSQDAFSSPAEAAAHVRNITLDLLSDLAARSSLASPAVALAADDQWDVEPGPRAAVP